MNAKPKSKTMAARTSPKPKTVEEEFENEMTGGSGAAGVDQSLDVIELDQNLDDYPEPELLPPGIYEAELQAVNQRTNQKGTGQYYAVEFVIPPENFPADYDVDNWPEGLKLYYNLLRVPTSGDRRSVANLRKFIEKIGLAVDTPRIDPNEWIGRRARLRVEHGVWEGNKREQIARNGVQPVA